MTGRSPTRPVGVIIPIVDGPIETDAARVALARLIRLRRIAHELLMTPESMRDRTRERPKRSARTVHALKTRGPIGEMLVRTFRLLKAITSRDEIVAAIRIPNHDVRIAVDGMYDRNSVPPTTTSPGHFESQGWHRISEIPKDEAEGPGHGLVVSEHPMNDGYRAGTIMSVAEDELAEAIHALRAIVDGHAVSPSEADEACRAMAEAQRRVRYRRGDGRCRVDFVGRRGNVHFLDQGSDGPWEPEQSDDPISVSGSRFVHVSLVDDDVIVRRWSTGFDDLLSVDPIATLRRASVVASVHERARAIGMVAPERTT